jgi:capsular exopolysaccharide synthesis family protein
MEQSGHPGQSHLRGYVQVLSRRRFLIALTALVGAGLALAWSFATTPSYSANAVVLIPAPAAGSPERSLADELQMARGDAVRQAAISALGYHAEVGVTSSSKADVLTFTAHSQDRARASAVANAYATAFIAERQSQASAAGSPPTVVKAAITPASDHRVRTLVSDGLVGLLVGLVAGIGLAFLADHLDEDIASRQVAEDACGGRPVVGVIPNVRPWRRRGAHLALAENASSGVAEAYRTLGTAVQLLGTRREGDDGRNRVVTVTSAGPGEGKTTAVANLAVCFARAGRRVIVLSGDLRRPRVHEFFGLANDTGLTSLYRGEALGDVLLPVPAEPRLRVIPSGPIPDNPAEILSVDGMRQLCGTLRQNADLVLIDSPPVLPVTDALLLSQLSDGVLIVASVTSGSRTDLDRAYRMLELVHAPVLGTMLNRVPTRGPRARAYGYTFTGGHPAAPATPKSASAAATPPPDKSQPPQPAVDLTTPLSPATPRTRPKVHSGGRRLDYSHEFAPSRARRK